MIIALALIVTAVVLFWLGQIMANKRAAKQRHATYLANYVPGRDGWSYGDPV
jgi:hypothetical protein